MPLYAEILSVGGGPAGHLSGGRASTSNRSAAHLSDRSSASGSLGRTASIQSSALPALPWSDWEIDPRDIHICKSEDGSDWKLGAGAYGTVRSRRAGSARAQLRRRLSSSASRVPW